MAETSLVVRDANSIHNSSPTFVFSVLGRCHPRMHQTLWMPYVQEQTTTVRVPGNEHDQSAQVECSNAIEIRDEIMFDFYLELPTSHKYLLHY